MIGEVIKLDETEQRITKHVAKNRTANNRGQGVKNSKRCKETDVEIERNSFGAELAFCKLFNVFPDFSIHIRSSFKGEDNGDAVVKNRVVDVKQTKYDHGKLIVVPWKAKESTIDSYALMTGEFPTYTFRGFIEAKEIMKPERLGNLGYGETYIAKQHELKELEELQCLKAQSLS